MSGTTSTGLDNSPRAIEYPMSVGNLDAKALLRLLRDPKTASDEVRSVLRASVRYSNPWTGQDTPVKPKITVREEREPLGKGDNPLVPERHGPRRWRVTCHPRCGRVEVLTFSRLDAIYRDHAARKELEARL